jgi:drug/metabolite transporter (DMT)-like permease
METLFNVLIPLALLAVTATLGWGIYSLYRGGEYARSRSNKLMRLRVVLQAVAIVILIAAFWWRKQTAG